MEIYQNTIELTDGEVLDIIFSKFGITDDKDFKYKIDVSNTELLLPDATQRLLIKIDKLLGAS